MWKLVIEDDESKRTVVPLTRDDYTIGRQEGNTIRLTERNVSRSHGRIRRKRNGSAKDVFVLEDRQSYNGVFVNGLRVATAQDLAHGDLIQIGDYRIVLHDDATSAVESTATVPISVAEPTHDAKATIPIASQFRHHAMTERPNRLVMLVGPTPGVEYPMDRERLSVGRAEDSTISVNHNSVSRLHCEIHSLGDGRFEIVDKGSSNGVRVNAVELKRSIIEAGDVIELGDVRFKFVGAGQVFVPGPNESQQLTAISDREAELVDSSRRGWGGYVMPVVGAGIVGACMILAFVYFLRTKATDPTPISPITSPTVDPELQMLAAARAKCTPEDCDASHAQINTLPPTSAARSSADFSAIEATWARGTIDKAKRTDLPIEERRQKLQAVQQAPTLDQALRNEAAQALVELADTPGQNPNSLPAVPTKDAGATTLTSATPPIKPKGERDPNAHPPTPTTTTTPPATTAPPSAKPAPTNVLEKATEASLQNRPAEVRQLLETKVRGGHASIDEARLVRAACKKMGDTSCKDDIDSKYPSLKPPQ